MPKKAVFVGSFTNIGRIPSDSKPHIAFAGRSNVGKSTLLNSLVGQKKLARVSKIPGRTQALNFFLIDERYYFVDFPGYGYAHAPRKSIREWGMLVDKYINTVDNLCGMIFLLDCRRDLNEDDLMLLEWLSSKDLPFVPVLTKADKLPRSKLMKKVAEISRIVHQDVVPFSILTGLGKKALIEQIKSLVLSRSKKLPEE